MFNPLGMPNQLHLGSVEYWQASGHEVKYLFIFRSSLFYGNRHYARYYLLLFPYIVRLIFYSKLRREHNSLYHLSYGLLTFYVVYLFRYTYYRIHYLLLEAETLLV